MNKKQILKTVRTIVGHGCSYADKRANGKHHYKYFIAPRKHNICSGLATIHQAKELHDKILNEFPQANINYGPVNRNHNKFMRDPWVSITI